MGKTGRRELGDHVMHTCHHTMPEPTPVLTMTSTSIKAVKPLRATGRPKNLAIRRHIVTQVSLACQTFRAGH